ncbi:MAG: ykoG [Chloroflexi bacterium]|nr:ykoG [Chloroflexota bacterium]
MISLQSVDHQSKGHILVVQDDYQSAHFIELELLQEGYEVTVACDGIAALVQARQCKPNLVVLDLMIPGIDGLEVCRRLRAGRLPFPDPPIMIVTSKDSIPDRVAGLKTGADDYVIKPFSIEELLARIEALLRRSGWYVPTSGGDSWLRMDDLVVNTLSREVRRGGATIDLTAKEYELLAYLLRHPHQVLTRGQIYEAVWRYDLDLESNVLEVYIRYLRNKLDRQRRSLIHTVRGVGYVMKDS